MKALTRLGQRRYPVQGGYTTEQARELALLSRALGRQVGLVIDRQGKVDMVIVGDPASILIPERRENPGDDLISWMVQAEFDGKKMTDDEL